jgi:hypothetical protein
VLQQSKFWSLLVAAAVEVDTLVAAVLVELCT